MDEPQILVADNPVDGDYFGDDVAISGDRILVGASERSVYALYEDGSCCNYNDTTSPQRGKAFMFVNNDGTWVQEGEPLYPDDEATDPRFHFGAHVALDGDVALIGHESDTGNYHWDEDTYQLSYSNLIVYVFSRVSTGSWEQLLTLNPSILDEQDFYYGYLFGRGVELKGNRALIEGNGMNAILLVDWEYVKTDGSFSYGMVWNSERLALGSNEFFLGAQPRINVIDNFSVLPVSLSKHMLVHCVNIVV
jgi:hypothetical protein